MKICDITLACGTRFVDVDLTTLWAVRGYTIGRVRGVEIVTEDHGYERKGVRFDVPGSGPVGPEEVYADRAKAYAVAIHAVKRMVERLVAEAAQPIQGMT